MAFRNKFIISAIVFLSAFITKRAFASASSDPLFGHTFIITSENRGKFIENFSVQNLDDEFYLSVKTNSKRCNLIQIKLNGRRILHLSGLVPLQKYLQQVHLKHNNVLSVRIWGPAEARATIEIVGLNAFKPIFGPLKITKNHKSQKYTFAAMSPDSDHIIKVEIGKRHGLFLGYLRVNNKLIASPLDFLFGGRVFFKKIQVKEKNEIEFLNLLGRHSPEITLTVLEPSSDHNVQSQISQAGGNLALPDLAVATFLPGTFERDTLVSLASTNTSVTAEDFDISTKIFGVRDRMDGEIRINTGSTMPLQDVYVTIHAQDDFVTKIQDTSEVSAFAQIFEVDDNDILDHFESIDIVDLNETEHSVTVRVPTAAFTDHRNTDQTYEAIIILGTVPEFDFETEFGDYPTILSVENAPPVASIMASVVYQPEDATQCAGPILGLPLKRPLTFVRGFNETLPHYGIDYVANNDDVTTMGSGKVLYVGYNIRNQIDPRLHLTKKGWGHFILIRHLNGSMTLYAHLNGDEIYVKAGDFVTFGQTIAKSDNSGGSTGPHLHIEYAPLLHGTYNASKKIDPKPCVGLSRPHTIVLFDHGVRKDDTASLLINNVPVITMVNGEATYFSVVGTLPPGKYTFTTVCQAAPDGSCTAAVAYGEGLLGPKSGSGSLSWLISPTAGGRGTSTVIIGD